MIEFYLNDKHVKTSERQGLPLLDFIRINKRLKGTKIGCREGDCGACTVLIGKLDNGQIHYQNITSCLTPLLNVHGCHVVTIEGLEMNGLNISQKMIVKHNGSQCGFCTPGFVTSMMGNVLPNKSNEACSIDGNICRCTGYKSIEKAYDEQEKILNTLGAIETSIEKAIELNLIPTYFNGIESRLDKINRYQINSENKIIGGGTDLIVQRPEAILDTPLNSLSHLPHPQIKEDKDNVYIDAHSTPTDLGNSAIIQRMIPNVKAFMKLVSSAPIRNIGTISGNLVNASPIGDLTAFFHGLDATLSIIDLEGHKRTTKMSDFFLDYKKIDLKNGERIAQLIIEKDAYLKFNFEKVSKRQHLDIATVNTALSISVDAHNIINKVYISAGGVGPTPMRLIGTEAFIMGKSLNTTTILESLSIVDQEIKPISDVRGSAEYKRLLYKQLYKTHFVSLFPHIELDIFKTA